MGLDQAPAGQQQLRLSQVAERQQEKKWPCLRRCWEASRWRPVRALTSSCTSSESMCSPGRLRTISTHCKRSGWKTTRCASTHSLVSRTQRPSSRWAQHGRSTQTITTIEGNSIIKVQTPDAATGYHTTREEREFSEDGTTMTLRLIIPAKPEIVCARVYKRVVPGAEGESEEKTEAAEENVAQW